MLLFGFAPGELNDPAGVPAHGDQGIPDLVGDVGRDPSHGGDFLGFDDRLLACSILSFSRSTMFMLLWLSMERAAWDAKI